VTVPVDISRGTCDRCGRIAGDYYASVIQIRATDRTPTPEETERATELVNEVVSGMEATGNRDAFVTDVSEVAEGLDIKVSTTKIGQQVAKRLVEQFGGSYSSSETLVTEDEDGNPVYRVTFAVRLPRFRPGEVIDTEQGPVLVRSVTGNLKGRLLATGEDFESDWDVEADRLGDLDNAERTTLVSVEDDRAVQVLDPETYRSKTVPRPADLDTDAESVRVLKSRAGLHILPDG
jgi:nonsense-mediated mRNA decay protein 3